MVERGYEGGLRAEERGIDQRPGGWEEECAEIEERSSHKALTKMQDAYMGQIARERGKREQKSKRKRDLVCDRVKVREIERGES